MKTITLLLDGAGDRTYGVLDHKTPLEYANTPNLDKIALKSQCGLMTPLEIGASLGTDLAHFILFGYELYEYPNRSIIDAIGEKINLTGNELVLRSSWAEVKHDGEGYMLNSRFSKDLSDKEISCLIESINCVVDGFKFTCVHSYDSHGFVVVTPENQDLKVSSDVSDSDPFYAPQYVMKVEAFESDEIGSQRMAGVINKFLKRTNEVLCNHEINSKRATKGLEQGNFVLTKWAGVYTPVESFVARTGMSGQLIGKSKLLQGISEYVDMDYVGYNDFSEAINMALESKYDYVHLHTKDPDVASHKKDPLKKVKALEAIDRLIGPLVEFEGLLIVTADHSTPCAGKMIHSGETVPFMAMGQHVRRDRVKHFNEIDCGLGSISLTAKDFMKYIQNATDRGNLYHLRAGRKRRNYIPRTVNKL